MGLMPRARRAPRPLGPTAMTGIASHDHPGPHRPRIAAVSSAARETAQGWAPETDEPAGISKRLWEQPDAGDASRVFCSTSEKGSSHTKKRQDNTRLTPQISEKTIR
jgi:hypothetical protein